MICYSDHIPFTVKQLFWCPVTPARILTFLGKCPGGDRSVLHPAWYCYHWPSDLCPLSAINIKPTSTAKPQDEHGCQQLLFVLHFILYYFRNITFLLLLVIQLQVEYKIEYEYFILGFFFSIGYLCASLCFGEERGRERKYKLIIIKIGRSICCLMLIDLAFNTSLKHFVLTKSMCWLAFERKTKNIMLCALPLCFQLVISE